MDTEVLNITEIKRNEVINLGDKTTNELRITDGRYVVGNMYLVNITDSDIGKCLFTVIDNCPNNAMMTQFFMSFKKNILYRRIRMKAWVDDQWSDIESIKIATEDIGDGAIGFSNLSQYLKNSINSINLSKVDAFSTVSGYKLTYDGKTIDSGYNIKSFLVTENTKIILNVNTDSEIAYQFRTSSQLEDDTNVVSSYMDNIYDEITVPSTAKVLCLSIKNTDNNSSIYTTDIKKLNEIVASNTESILDVENKTTGIGDVSEIADYMPGGSSDILYEGQLSFDKLTVSTELLSSAGQAKFYNTSQLVDANGNHNLSKISIYLTPNMGFKNGEATVTKYDVMLFVATGVASAYATDVLKSSVITNITGAGWYDLDMRDVDLGDTSRILVGYNVSHIYYDDGTSDASVTKKRYFYATKVSTANQEANAFLDDTNGKTSFYNTLVPTTNPDRINVYFFAENNINSNRLPLTHFFYKPSNDTNLSSVLKEQCERIDKLDIATRTTKSDNPLFPTLYDGGLTRIFKSIVCIGDSLTGGVIAHKVYDTDGTTLKNNESTSFPDYSYPTYMARSLGSNVMSFGYGGRTAANKHSLDTTDTHSWFYWGRTVKGEWLNVEENKADCYIVALGTNDIAVYGSFSGDLTTDIAVGTDSITVNDKSTSVGGYCEILNSIYKIQSRARVFCVTLPNTRQTAETRTEMNTKVKAIIEAYKSINKYIYCVDLETYGIQPDDVSAFKSANYTGGHLNPFGYKWLSDTIVTYINYIIEHNLQDFKNIEIVDSTTKFDY